MLCQVGSVRGRHETHLADVHLSSNGKKLAHGNPEFYIPEKIFGAQKTCAPDESK